ncbi:class I fructose-bisphosphate aldolase [Amycolatopsis jejuensis]|uniref:class I fructose-bisphosphate aldolase n=1 Tax=Amycolatopsis jejuensis TaxID=330084 RepID=UPI0006893463|nr:hypothetical protein [Amycolatopsis jejuensis]
MHLTTTVEAGHARRMARLFAADRKSLIIGYDHAVSAGTAGGALAALPALAELSGKGGADGLQMGLHAARQLDPDGAGPQLGLVLRIDRSAVGDDPHQLVGPPARWASAAQVLHADGDAAVVYYIHDTRRIDENNAYAVMIGETAQECGALGLPLMVEVMVKTERGASPVATSQAMADAARIAFELGADLVKIDRTPHPEAMPDLVAAVPVPVLLRGGPPQDTVTGTLADLERSLGAGVAGAVYGRTVWHHGDPEGMTRTLSAVVHGTPAGAFR